MIATCVPSRMKLFSCVASNAVFAHTALQFVTAFNWL